MTADNRVQSTLFEGMRDLLNLLVHIQTLLANCGLEVIRAGGGLTFSGFSIQVAPNAPVDWVGYHYDRPKEVIYQIQDRKLADNCPLDRLKRLDQRRYERSFPLEDSFFLGDEAGQIKLLEAFVRETVAYLKSHPEQGESASDEPFIPILS